MIACCSSSNVKSIRSPPLCSVESRPPAPDAKTGNVSSSSNVSNPAITGIPMDMALGRNVADIGHQAGALLEFDKGHDQRIVERRHLGVVIDHEAVDSAPSRCGHRVPLERTALSTRWARGVPQGAAVGASLDEESVIFCPVEEESIVLGEGGPGALRTCLLLLGTLCFVGLRLRLELEDAEQHGRDRVPVLIGELQAGGDEVTVPEPGLLLG